MSKGDKLYKDSPEIKKDEDGKPGIKKPAASDAVAMGTEGNPIPGSDGKMPVDVHAEERNSMHRRHEEEQKGMHSRHEKDLKEMHKRHEKTNEKEAPAVEGTK